MQITGMLFKGDTLTLTVYEGLYCGFFKVYTTLHYFILIVKMFCIYLFILNDYVSFYLKTYKNDVR